MRFSQLSRPCLATASALAALTPLIALAQTDGARAAAATPVFWYLLAAAMAILTAVGLVLIGVAGLEHARAWDAALGAVAAIGLATLAYWAIGFALQFGGVGLVYPRPELHGLVWEWSPLSMDWGVGWGVAGLSGWLLAGREMTALVHVLFLSHLPWLFVVTLLPVMALRGRAPMLATLAIALLMGGIVYPLAGNWVQGGGWLSALGRNLNLGHGFIDAGGAGTVFLLAAAFGLVALAVWTPRRPATDDLPPDYQPLLTVAGSLLVLAGLIGWLWANPLQVETLGDLGMARGSVNVLLAAAAGVVAPLLYTWFVTGRSHPTLVARGLVAGAVAGLAAAPFTSPGAALVIGGLAGATTPLLAYVVDGLLRLDDATGLVVTAGAPALIGLLLAGIVADGAAGVGWQMTGLDAHLGVTGQGVSGLLVAQGFQPDFPGQFQAQLVGVAVLILWGVLTGLLISAPLGLIFWGLQHSERATPAEVTPSLPRVATEVELTPSERRRVFPPFPSDPAA
jgi:Amt family ammonium transporter